MDLPKVSGEQINEHAVHKTDAEGGEGLKYTRQDEVLEGVLHIVQADGDGCCDYQAGNWNKTNNGIRI